MHDCSAAILHQELSRFHIGLCRVYGCRVNIYLMEVDRVQADTHGHCL